MTAPAVPPRPPAVLVAEDNAISLQVILHQLRTCGCEPHGTEDGLAAAAAWRRGGFDLLITDLQMPGLDGYELATLIRREEGAGTRLPIVALTGNSSPAEAERCRAIGIDEYATKPITPQALRLLLEKWLAPAA